MDTSELTALKKDARRLERMLTDLDAMMTNRIGRLEQVVWPTPDRPPLGEELQQFCDRLNDLARRLIELAKLGERADEALDQHLRYHLHVDKVRKSDSMLTFLGVGVFVAYTVFVIAQFMWSN